MAAEPPARVEIQQLTVHADGRGAVFEPLAPALLQGWRNVHAVVTEPGAIRGNHRHVRGTEVTAVLGPALVRYRSGERTDEFSVPAGEAWRFVFPPGTAHAFKNTGAKPFVLVSFNTELHDAARPDVERVELIA
ncbi:MAG TPA: cupin domain-containing protein [Steroidobacteraceae bacterium]|jgi:dTDP-4-dehydrorhamnose 3,5-epimerase-like enzyme